MKAITKYPGSKWSIADWIINFFPEHHSYLEPFFGSGAVLFNKPRSHIETINDLDGSRIRIRQERNRRKNETMYIVPMEIPKYCNNRPFGRANYTYPLWGEWGKAHKCS